MKLIVARAKAEYGHGRGLCTRKEIDCVYEQPRKELTASEASVTVSSHGRRSNNNAVESIPISNPLEEVLDGDLAGFDPSRHMLGDDTNGSPAVSAPEHELNGYQKHKDLTTIGGTSMPTTMSSEMDNFMSFLQPDSFDLTSSINIEKGQNYVSVQPPTYSPMSGTEITTTTVHFSQKQIITPAQQLFTSMLIDMIRAYPLMMTRRETFPPFVHPHCYLYEGCNTFPQVLTNCMGIAQLFVSRTNDTRPFLWTTILAEVRDMLSKVPIFELYQLRVACADIKAQQLGSMNKFELFSALQASLLYLIMRAIDTGSQQPAQDFELVRAHEMICDYTLQQIGHHADPEVNDPQRRWKDWIFDESIKRVAWVWFSLSVVYQIRSGVPGVPCRVADSTDGMPLPCTKTEWEAQTEEDWRREYYKARNSQSTASIQTFGDLANAYRGLPADRAAKATQLEAWNAGIDNLGVLLNLAVYMTRT
ncbi:Hypothetical protein PENO1_007540 [Penicillium occitanis (nom. inval.)]|nr:hypothetical protein PENOC_028520 [Penicillium occitanis (nom. inval.)]PCH08260.1 Hypothetical protein PENO1_007540 [Penicillium occitanis (nom. inval.)]